MSDPHKAHVSIPPLSQTERAQGAHDDRTSHKHHRPIHHEFQARHSSVDPSLIDAERRDDVPDPDFIKSEVTRSNPMIAVGITVICAAVLVAILILIF